MLFGSYLQGFRPHSGAVRTAIADKTVAGQDDEINKSPRHFPLSVQWLTEMTLTLFAVCLDSRKEKTAVSLFSPLFNDWWSKELEDQTPHHFIKMALLVSAVSRSELFSHCHILYLWALTWHWISALSQLCSIFQGRCCSNPPLRQCISLPFLLLFFSLNLLGLVVCGVQTICNKWSTPPSAVQWPHKHDI